MNLPPTQLRAAIIAGELAAEGKIVMLDILQDIADAAQRAMPETDRSGLRIRLAHIMADSAQLRRIAIGRARYAVARAAATALAQRKSRRAVLAAAGLADPRNILPRAERESIALAELARVMGRWK